MKLGEYELSKWNEVKKNINDIQKFVEEVIMLKKELINNFLYNPFSEINNWDMILNHVSNSGVTVKKWDIFYHLLNNGKVYMISHLWNRTLYLDKNQKVTKFNRHFYFEVSRACNTVSNI